MITALNATPTAAGAGYVVGDILNITTGGLGAQCRVKTIGGSGDVTAVDIVTGGGGYTTGAGKVTTGGSGDGNCTVNITTVNAVGAGALYPVVDTTATTVVLDNGAIPADGTATFVIFKLVATDITSGMTTGNKILTLLNSDAELKHFGIPATSNSTGSASYGNDGYYFDKLTTTDRAASWGGNFSTAANAGVFALYLGNAPSYSAGSLGFRACKAL